ncbi:xenobiotic compound [Phlyctema vagabunda]|uniref:Xenobiotic compound n=1 Tax=Phlyctema vagabunda TaxID=108571 RepID=A0ABR4P2J2_9HELO
MSSNDSLETPREASEAPRAESGGKDKKKSLILNAFVEMCSGHQSPGLWRHPDDESHRFNDLDYWTELAQTLEKAKFHGIFIADVLGGYDVYGGPKNLDPAIASAAQWPVNEPLAIVTGYLDSAARNLGHTEQPQHDERYAIAEEYLEVMYKLWESSWRDDAVVRDAKKAIYTDPSRVREINHVGKYFNVPGPHICQPSRQRTPVLMQAGTSSSGKRFAAKNAEAIFVAGHSPSVVANSIRDIRAQAKDFGRDEKSVKFLAMICPVLGKTEEEAVAKYEDYLSYGSEDGAFALFGGWTGIDLAKYADDEELRHVESNAIRSAVEGWSKASPGVAKWTKHTVARHMMIGGLGATVVGTPAQVADEFERWVSEGDVDGFNIAYAITPGSFNDVIELLLPELKKRGLFWDDYEAPGGTYRENLYSKKGGSGLPSDHPAHGYRWRAKDN